MMALVDNPDQRDWLMEDFDDRIGTAVEEFVRWASPVHAVRPVRHRRTPRSTGSRSRPGTRWACSTARPTATRRVVRPTRARSTCSRSPNPHLGFGGGGPHFCLGNQLAKAELRNLFRELLTRLKTVEFGEPDLLYSSFVHGVKRLPAHVQ